MHSVFLGTPCVVLDELEVGRVILERICSLRSSFCLFPIEPQLLQESFANLESPSISLSLRLFVSLN